jgi:hypothetical protein
MDLKETGCELHVSQLRNFVNTALNLLVSLKLGRYVFRRRALYHQVSNLGQEEVESIGRAEGFPLVLFMDISSV